VCKVAEPGKNRVFPGHESQPSLYRPGAELPQHVLQLSEDGQRLHVGRGRPAVRRQVFTF